MTELLQRIRDRSAFANVDGNGPEFERGRQRAHAYLSPLIEALIQAVEKAEKELMRIRSVDPVDAARDFNCTPRAIASDARASIHAILEAAAGKP